MTKTLIQLSGWDVFPHPPYLPYLAPSYIRLYQSLTNALRGLMFNIDIGLRVRLEDFFSSKPDFFIKV